MIYGKVEYRSPGHHGPIHLTVTAGVCSLKQGGDLIRFTMAELRQFASDALEALDSLAAANPEDGRGDG